MLVSVCSRVVYITHIYIEREICKWQLSIMLILCGCSLVTGLSKYHASAQISRQIFIPSFTIFVECGDLKMRLNRNISYNAPNDKAPPKI